MDEVIILYRPIGPKELDLIKQSDYKKWPPRLQGQPFFYPVTNEPYAREISSEWNLKESGTGYVTRFRVKKIFIDKYEIKQVGASYHMEYAIPAEALEELNNSSR